MSLHSGGDEMKLKGLCFFVLFCLVATLVATDVSGNVSGIWSVVNSPYNIVGDITIPAGESLTLEPGVMVRAMGNFRITAAGHINAIGNAADSIRFVNGQISPTALWKGIRLENTGMTSEFAHCYIENGENGIYTINSPVNISHSHFRGNTKGIHAYAIGTPNPATVNISYCLVEYSGENGILISQNSNTSVQHCEIRNNGVSSTYRGAIQLSNQSAGGNNNPLIAHNHIHHNVWQGITAWDIVGASAINPIIHNNLINNNLTGIYLLNASGYLYDNIITQNFIPGDMNSGAGVMVSGATSVPYFERNIVTYNFTGFYITNNARPVLGDLAQNHPWAQGENVIRNNVDALGEPHSVVCASYPQSGNIIKAENNYWDFNDAEGIALYITDGVDNPALPIVDFEPFLLYSPPISIIGNVVNSSSFQISQQRLQLVSVSTGEILFESFVHPNGLINVEAFINENFYGVVKAIREGTEGSYIYGCAGTLDNPVIFDPQEVVNLGTIHIVDAMPRYYERIGAPVVEDELIVYPLISQFFVYRFGTIDWLYRSGDYLYLKRHTSSLGGQIQETELPAGSIFMKVANLNDGDSWQRTEVLTNGQILSFDVAYHEVLYPPDIMPYPPAGSLMIQTDANGNVYSEILFNTFDVHPRQHRYYYSDDFTMIAYALELENALPDNTIFPLAEGNRWVSSPTDQSVVAPSLFTIRPSFIDDSLDFFWQAPVYADTLWTAYRIYKNMELWVEVPLGQRHYHWEDANLFNEAMIFWVVATDGVNESGHSNYAAIGPSGIEANTTPPAKLKLGPNPFVLSKNHRVNIELDAGAKGNAELRIFNLRGQQVQGIRFHNETVVNYQWDGKDHRGRSCSSGIYFVQIKHDRLPLQKTKLLLVK